MKSTYFPFPVPPHVFSQEYALQGEYVKSGVVGELNGRKSRDLRELLWVKQTEPPIAGNGLYMFIPPIKMLMTGGWCKWLFFTHINYQEITPMILW